VGGLWLFEDKYGYGTNYFIVTTETIGFEPDPEKEYLYTRAGDEWVVSVKPIGEKKGE
jgi:hypothetical protein